MRKKWWWMVLVAAVLMVVPIAYAEEEVATIAGTSLGFQPVPGLTETPEFQGYASEESQLYVMAMELPKSYTLKTLDDFDKLLQANEDAPELTVIAKQRDLVEGVSSLFVQYAIQQQDIDVVQWIFVLEGEKKFGQVVISTTKQYAEEHTEELLTMLKSFRWMENVRPVLTYSLDLPEGWFLAEGDEEMAVYAREGDSPEDRSAPLLIVVNFKSPIRAELREGFIQEFFMPEEANKLIGTENLTIDSEEAILYFIDDVNSAGKETVNMVCMIYTPKTAYGLMAVQNEAMTTGFFKSLIMSWKLLK